MFRGHWFAADFGFFGSFTKRQETEVITWVSHSHCFRGFSLACSVQKRVVSDFFLVALQVNSSETLDCSAGSSANVLKFVKNFGTWLSTQLWWFFHTNRLFGFKHGPLGPCALTVQPSFPVSWKGPKFSWLFSFPFTWPRVSWWGLSVCFYCISLLSQQFTLSFLSSSPNTLAPWYLISAVPGAEEFSWCADPLWLYAQERCANPNFLPLEFALAQGCFTSYQQFAQGWLPAVVFSFLPPAATLTIGTAAGGKNERTRLKEALCHCCNFEIDGVF